MAPGDVLHYEFEDQLFAQGQTLFRNLSSAFTGLAVIACMICVFGLLGMASHMTGRRRHEIGVRKTLGASRGQVLRQLLWEFSLPVVVASVVAWPLAYVAARTYLNIFIEHAPLTALPFLLTFLVTLSIAWIAVGGQVWNAAHTTPATVLRAE
jgi:putative ABC transport system permease protein